jgi:hypothetical protein
MKRLNQQRSRGFGLGRLLKSITIASASSTAAVGIRIHLGHRQAKRRVAGGKRSESAAQPPIKLRLRSISLERARNRLTARGRLTKTRYPQICSG